MADDDFQRFVLLNRLVSISTSHAPTAYKPPLVAASTLLEALEDRKAAGHAIEFIGAKEAERDAEETEDERIARCSGLNFILLRDMKIDQDGEYSYAKLLLEFVDHGKRTFSVVDTESLEGRDIAGEKNERGGISTHIVVRLPKSQHDDGQYRCAIEVAHSFNRQMIETFICKQLRRWARAEELTYPVRAPDKRKPGQMNTKDYKYTPRLELVADVGRTLSFATAGGRELAQMIFSKRSAKQSIGGKDHVVDEEIIADVELRVKAQNGPADPLERIKWFTGIRSLYETNGYKTSLSYRQLNGGVVTGKVHQALAGATDLVMCQKELMSLKHDYREWYPKIDDEIADQMATFVDKDELWQRGK
ncbi:hypothetical protein [Bradyrhizobium japonicum]|uniref:hypothetical protein n=1 Tax=Bradyrhizobium japonicum TaxID=375 RepID=UPI00200C1FCB|nr:hypothetical protein [Bradyrhizobium japonicum]UQD96128.1 hypothetical protein JEY30_31805 [Bradyrhizobium japonicum]